MSKNPKVKLVGFFGQSGAGKTTIIRNLSSMDGRTVLANTGITRSLRTKNPNTYFEPLELLNKYGRDIDSMKPNEKNAKIDEIYEKYIRGQMQLLNDYSTEIFQDTRDEYKSATVLVYDRSPLDFYTVTECGVAYLKSVLNKDLNDVCKHLLLLCKKTAEINTKNFFDAIFVTYPWVSPELKRESLVDGVRDHYLSEFYVGENWYGIINKVNIKPVKIFTIESDVTDLMKRANIVNKKLMEV
jgi:hypothetical protein